MPVGCQGGGVGHDAVGSSSSCRGWRNLLCLHILPGSLAGWLRDSVLNISPSLYTACQKPNTVCYVYTFRLLLKVHSTTLMTAVKIEVEVEVTLGH